MCNAVTIVAFVATAVTTVPVSRPVIAILRASAESTLLSDGTGNTAGFANVVPVETDEPPTVNALVAAIAFVALSIAIVMAAAKAIDVFFLNEFILFISPFIRSNSRNGILF